MKIKTPLWIVMAFLVCALTFGGIQGCGSSGTPEAPGNLAPGICGDGVLNLGESCDGSALGSKSCSDVDSLIFAGGALTCAQNCTFETSACIKHGDFKWVQHIGGSGDEMVTLATDPTSDKLYVAGIFSSSTLSFPGVGDITNSHSGGSVFTDGFYGKFDPVSQTYDWVQHIKGDLYSFRLVSDSKGNVYAGGSFWKYAPLSLPGLPDLISPGGNNGFFGKLDSQTGIFQWVQQISGNDDIEVFSLAIDANNNLYVGGSFYSSTLTLPGLAPLSKSTGAQVNGFFGKFNPTTQKFEWAEQVSGIKVWVYALTVDSNGKVYVGGEFIDSNLSLPGGVSLMNSSESEMSDGLLGAYDPSTHQFLWAKSIQGAGEENILTLSMGPNGEILVGGYFGSFLTTFPGGSVLHVQSVSEYAGYFGSLNPASQTFEWVRPLLGVGGDMYTTSFLPKSQGGYYLSGHFYSPSLTLPGLSPLTNPNPISSDTFFGEIVP